MRNKFIGIAALSVVGSLASADIVLNLIPGLEADSNNTWASQDFEAANNAFDVAALENFTVTATQRHITEVEVLMGGYTGFTSAAQWSLVTGFRVEFFTSIAAGAASLTGNAGSQLVAAGSVTNTNLGWTNATFFHNGTQALIRIPTNVVLASAGTYYVGVMGVMDAGLSTNQVGVGNNTASAGGQNGTLVNPGGGFGIGGGLNTGNDLAYKITGNNPIPEPASMIALGIGAAALVARRRKRTA